MKVQALNNVMVSIAMRRDKSRDVFAAGFNRVMRTRQEQEALTRLYEETAKVQTPSLDINRLGRTDATGQAQVDGGYLLFKAGGQSMVCPDKLRADMERVRFNLRVAEIFEKEGDDNVRLRLTWSRGGVELELNQNQQAVAQKYLSITYWKLFGFFNPKAVSLAGEESPIQGSIVTLNFSGVVVNRTNPADDVDQIRYIRMVDADGHLRCDRNGTALDYATMYRPPADTANLGLSLPGA